MGFEIINRVLKELNLEQYKTKLIARGMDDETLGAIVDRGDANFHLIIGKIIPTLSHAIQIRKKFKELFSRNQGERGTSRDGSEGKGSSAGSNSSRTDSLLTVTMAAQQKLKTGASAEKSAESRAPGSSPRLDDGQHQNRNRNRNRKRAKPPIPEFVGSSNSSGDGETGKDGGLESFQAPLARPVRKRKMLPSELNRPASTPQESKNQVIKAKSNKTPRFNGV